MRADRLVAVLLLLQARGKVTASEVAEELEISERTARRDLEALGMAGLPIYSTQGRGGGWQLLGGGRTDLSGLNADEVRALFSVVGPSSPTPEVKAAVRKLVRALPERLRRQAERAQSSLLVDPAGWDRPARRRFTPAHLDDVQRAVVQAVQISLGYVARDGTPSTRLVQPLGLAAKGTAWYLIANTEAGLRTFRVDRITAVEDTGQPFERPADFDLSETWRGITAEIDERRTPLKAEARADPEVVPWCRAVFGTRVRIGPPSDDGRVQLELRGHGPRPLAFELAGFGDAVEVLGPPEVREELVAIGHALVTRYNEVNRSSSRRRRASRSRTIAPTAVRATVPRHP